MNQKNIADTVTTPDETPTTDAGPGPILIPGPRPQTEQPEPAAE